MDVIQNVFSGNIISYAVVAVALAFFRKSQPRINNELERTVLALNNEIQRMRTEIKWKNNAILQGKSIMPQSAVHSLQSVVHI
ncbi:uncharacterized protein OCT59_023502 [Rhizophagus irregularis]|uniref:uncharacterized protein n=1 Tax=Rhizophagus irregularis TaxID=588596 RepID=UPI00332EA572|nr:hypothetical protein OCT59_023502 [Rhizophagus irregularis]